MALTVELLTAPLALRDEVTAAGGTHASRTSLFLRLHCDGVVGWGECAAAMRAGMDATPDEVAAALTERVLPRAMQAAGARGTALPAPHTVVAAAARRPADVAAAALVEMAIVDLELRREGSSLCTRLGVRDATVGFAGVVGIDEPAAARDRAARLVALGATRIRVKVAPRSGTAAIRTVLDEVHVPVAADANGSFDPVVDTSALDELLELPLAWVEQPFSAADLASHAALAARAPMSICLDESVRSVRSVRDIARYEAGAIVCVKPVRVGGIARTLEVRREAARLGLRSYVGGYFEAGLARAVLGAIAAAQPEAVDGDVVAPCTYLEIDPCGLEPPAHGRQPLHAGPGCGPTPDPGLLTSLVVLSC